MGLGAVSPASATSAETLLSVPGQLCGSRSSSSILGVVAAWPGEARCLGLRNPTRGRIKAVTPNLLVSLSGSGATAAEQASRQLLEAGADRLLSWGVGGALQPDWQPGELLVPDTLLHGEQHLPLDRVWSQLLREGLRQNGLGARVGSLWHTPGLLDTPGAKRRAGTLSGAALADMESLGVVRTANAARRPVAILRATADPLELTLPGCVTGAMDDNANWHWGHFGLGFLTRPSSWPTQWRGLAALFSCYRRALHSLRRAAPCLHSIEFDTSHAGKEQTPP